MESFHWNQHFATGLSEVDEQHRHLVELINQFGALVLDDKVSPKDMESVFGELAEYSKYHFEEEERLMRDAGVDADHVNRHVATHNDFLQEVTAMHAGVSLDRPESVKQLLSFLTHWLVYHILGLDQNMGRQVHAIDSGVSASEAFQKEELRHGETTEPLINALDSLFDLVSSRNKELVLLNQTLETKVAERTQELQEANKHLEELALTDVLTQLPNRRHAMRRLDDLWRESTKSETPLVCIMIDADHFKEVNDSWGHDAGDAVLRELANTLRDNMRTDDIVCRLGGDEFFVLCPTTNLEGGLYIAEQVRINVSELHVHTGDGAWTGSISVGVASRTAEMANYNDLIKLADQGVYAAKEAGKNCVRSVCETPPTAL